MAGLDPYQLALIALVFIWSGFTRTGLGFGGAVLTLPFLLLITDRPLVFLPIIGVHLLFFSSLTIFQAHRRAAKLPEKAGSTVDWRYLRYALGIMLIPKLVGVFGLITLPADILSIIIFCIIIVYSLSYIFNKPFSTQNPWVEKVLLALGGYVSGTSLTSAPLVMAVVANHVEKRQLRDTLFALWFVLVSIKILAFIYAGVDLQLIHHVWLLPCAALGHMAGLRFHEKIVGMENGHFFRGLGAILLIVSMLGIVQVITT